MLPGKVRGMMGDNPLVTWLWFERSGLMPEAAKVLPGVEAWLAEVARALEQPRPEYPWARFVDVPVRLPPASRKRAQDLFLRVWQAPGTNKLVAEGRLLGLVGSSADPASIPFWKEVVALHQPRDRFASKRRALAAAGLALTALRHPESGAFAALEAITRDEHPDACAAAADTLAQLAVDKEGPLVRPALDALRRVAVLPGPFAACFLARRFLLRAGEPLPAYDTGTAIAFEVAFGKCRRTLELAAEQTLSDLHDAILDAFDWDADHLHRFSLNGDLDDPRFVIPGFDEEGPPFPFDLPSEEGEDEPPPEEEEEEEEAFPLGAMGLPVGHAIAYLYDFGDSNVFRIKVAAVHPKAPGAKYPRVTAKVGKAPGQYAPP